MATKKIRIFVDDSARSSESGCCQRCQCGARSISDQATDLERQVRTMQLDLENLHRQLSSACMERESAIHENGQLQEEIAAMSCELRSLRSELEAAKTESHDLKRQLQTYVSEVRRAEDLLDQKENERTEMLNHFRSLSMEASVLESNNHSLETEAAEAKTALQSARDQVTDLERQLSDKECLMREYETQINELSQNVASLEIQLQQAIDERERAEEDLRTVRDLCCSLETQKDCLSKQLEEALELKSQCEIQLSRYRSEQEIFQEQMTKDHKQIDRLERLLEEARRETMSSQSNSREVQSEVSRLKQKISDLQTKLCTESSELRKYQTQASEYSKQISELRRQVTNERFDKAKRKDDGGNTSNCNVAWKDLQRNKLSRQASKTFQPKWTSCKSGVGTNDPCKTKSDRCGGIKTPRPRSATTHDSGVCSGAESTRTKRMVCEKAVVTCACLDKLIAERESASSVGSTCKKCGGWKKTRALEISSTDLVEDTLNLISKLVESRKKSRGNRGEGVEVSTGKDICHQICGHETARKDALSQVCQEDKALRDSATQACIEKTARSDGTTQVCPEERARRDTITQVREEEVAYRNAPTQVCEATISPASSCHDETTQTESGDDLTRCNAMSPMHLVNILEDIQRYAQSLQEYFLEAVSNKHASFIPPSKRCDDRAFDVPRATSPDQSLPTEKLSNLSLPEATPFTSTPRSSIFEYTSDPTPSAMSKTENTEGTFSSDSSSTSDDEKYSLDSTHHVALPPILKPAKSYARQGDDSLEIDSTQYPDLPKRVVPDPRHSCRLQAQIDDVYSNAETMQEKLARLRKDLQIDCEKSRRKNSQNE